MPAIEENFSKIVRSLLLDVDIHLDQLEQIGYLSKEQRAFLDKFLYKSEDALRAATLTRGSHSSDLLLTKLPSTVETSPSILMLSPSKSENGVSTVTSRALPRLRSVTEQLKSEENGLTTFLKRCNDRNFSVKVRGSDIGKESTNKVKGSEYILTLEPIAEGAVKAGGSKVDTKGHNGKLRESVNYDTDMMLHGADNLTRDIDIESVDYETAIHTDAVANLNSDEIEHTINEAVDIKPAKADTHYNKAIEFRAAGVKPTSIQPTVKPTKVELTQVEPTDLTHSKSQSIDDCTTKIKLADAGVTNEQKQIQNNDQRDDAIALPNPMADTAEEVETNAWGKPVKPDRTRNKEGAIVGGSAKPLGSENKGRAMMEKMGWSKGTGLGKQKGGILEPITHVVKNTKAGLRSSNEKKQKSRLNSPAAVGNTPNSIQGEGNLLESGLVIADNSDRDKAPENSDWVNSIEMTAEQIQFAADWAAAKKHADELNKAEAEAARGRSKAPFKGIKAFYIRGPEDPGPEKTIKFRSKIQSTNEYKTTKHYPGVVIRAISAQPSDFLNQKNGFKVACGNHLEILRTHQGDEYHVFNFNQKKRGIVKISLVEVLEELEAPLADVVSWTSSPAIATT